jgi:hypothetical protein
VNRGCRSNTASLDSAISGLSMARLSLGRATVRASGVSAGMETRFGGGRFEEVRTALRINTWELYLVLPLEGLPP